MSGWLILAVLASFGAVVWALARRDRLEIRGDRVPTLNRHSIRADAIAAVLLGLVSGLMAWGDAFSSSLWAPWFAAIWAFAMWIPLIWRRRAPVPAVFAVAVIAALHIAAGFPFLFPADLAILVALYSVAAYGPRWAHRAALAVAVLGAASLAVTLIRATGAIGTENLFDILSIAIVGSALALAAWALGLMRGARFETVAALRERAAALEDRARQLEIERDQQAQIATQAERARIARELHDIVAHSLSIMIVQADGGRYAAATSPETATTALATIASTGREALAQMRQLLGVLRSDADDGAAELRPIGDAAELQELFGQAAAAGMDVTITTIGEPRQLSSGAALTLHRAAQEALTNVRKHAGPGARVAVALTWTPDAVELVVTDDGPGAASVPLTDAAQLLTAAPGFGLIGLRERAALVSGTVEAGPRPGGGWTTAVKMPG